MGEERKEFEDKVVRDLLSGVRMAISQKSEEQGVEVVEAKDLEVKEGFQPGVRGAESIGSIDEYFSKKIEGVLERVSDFMESSKGDFKRALRGQVDVIRREVRTLGDYLAKVFAKKLNLEYVERHLRSTYEDVVKKKMREKEKEITRDTLKEILPFYKKLRQNLNMVNEEMREIKEAYSNILSEVVLMSTKMVRKGEGGGKGELQSIQRLREQLKEKSKRIEELKEKAKAPPERSQNTELRRKNEELSELLTEKRKELSAMKDKCEELEEQVASLQGKGEAPSVEELREKIASLEEEKEELREELASVKEKKQGLMRQVSSLRREKEELAKSLGSKGGERYEELKDTYYDLKGKYRAKVREVEAQSKEIEKLESMLSKLREGRTELSELKELREHYESLLERKEDQIQELEERLEKRRKAREAIDKMRSELREEVQKLRERAETRKTGKAEEEFSDFVSSLEDRFSSLRKGISEQVAKVTDVSSENVALKEKIDRLRGQIDEFEEENEKIRTQMEETKKELKQVKNKNEFLQKKVDEKEEKIEELKKKPEEMRKVLTSTPLGEAYNLIRGLEETSFDRLASSMGTSAIKVRRYVMKLVKAGLAEVKGRNVIYKGEIEG